MKKIIEHTVAVPAIGLVNSNAGDIRPAPITAVDRLNLSRASIYQNMRDSLQSQSVTRKKKLSGDNFHWLDSLESMPGGSVLMHAVNIWWSKQPLRAVALAAADAAKTIILPIAQRHPIALVIGAFALGGAIAWNRPWRWVSKPIVLSGLLAPLLSKVISNMPTGIWAEAFSSLFRQTQDNPSDMS